MNDRIYTEAEVRAIIQRAVELQEQTPTPEHGLTIDELERLGSEVGLDAAYLRAAASEVASTGQTLQQRFEMTDTHVAVERWLDGPLSAAGWEDAVVLLRQRFGIDYRTMSGRSGEGSIETVGNAQEWVHTSSLGVETRVGVSERGDRVRLRLSQRVGHAKPATEGKWYGAGVGMLAGLVAGTIAAGMTEIGGAFAVAFVIATVLTAFVAAPVIEGLDRRWRQKKLVRLGTLADDVSATLAAPAGVPAGAASNGTAVGSAQESTTPRLALDDEAPADRAETPTRTRTRA